jgi:hypothetical protein
VEPVTWRGRETFDHEVDLELEMPQGRCGSDADPEVRLSYRLDDGPPQVSTTSATDRYGAIGLLLDRDCAAGVLGEAAEVQVGQPRVVGAGPDSVLELPVELAPTGARDDVVVRGFDDTVLFSQAPGSASSEAGTRIPLGPDDPTTEVALRVVPARCDPHALAEDKVGTLFPVRVEAPDVPPSAADPYLPLDEDTRSALRAFVPVHCGW